MIRQARQDDRERLLEMGMRFVAETEYRDLISAKPERIAATIDHVLGLPDGVVLVSENGKGVNGMIGLMAYDHPFSGERTAFEVVWWVDPEARGDGVRLLYAAEKWALAQGAKAIQMVAPNERVGNLYARMGYRPVETSYQRSL